MIRFAEFVNYLEKNFNGLLSPIAESFRSSEGKATGEATGSVNGQTFSFFLVWSERDREWLLAGIRRASDGLKVFQAKEVFAKAKIFLQFRLSRFKDDFLLMVFGREKDKEFRLRNVFPLRLLAPARAEISSFAPLFLQNGNELVLPSADVVRLIALKDEFARECGLVSFATPLESKVLAMELARRNAEAEDRRKAEAEAERERKQARKQARDQRREEFKARPKLIAYSGEKVFSGRPVTAEEYDAREHYVLGDGTPLLVVEFYDSATGRAEEPKKFFVLRKRAGGEVSEENEAGELSFKRPKKESEELVLEGQTEVVMVKGAVQAVLVLDREQLAALRKRGVNSGTLFFVKGETDERGRKVVYRLRDQEVETVGPAEKI